MENKIETRCLSGKFEYFKQSRVTTDANAILKLIIGYTIAMIKIKNFHYLYTILYVFLFYFILYIFILLLWYTIKLTRFIVAVVIRV